jgi:type VI secretion system ImpM family protein
MLGIGPVARTWCWRAAGKHPAAGDFVEVGQGTPLTDALADWMTRGYLALQRSGSLSAEPCSWRFWMQGGRKGRLICGLARDSSDRIGRPFPFMIAGEGDWEGWEQRWVEMPLLLAGYWRRLERIASRRYDHIHELSMDISQLGSPEAENGGEGGAEAQMVSTPPIDSCTGTESLPSSGCHIIALDDPDEPDPSLALLNRHRKLAGCGAAAPRAEFIGGTAQRGFVVLFMQPLGAAAFETLWGNKGVQGHGRQ